jgi:hypothetical protein
MEAMRNAYTFLVRKPDGDRPLGRRRLRWEDDTKMNEINRVYVNWINLIQDRDQWRALVNMAMNLRFP